MGVRVEANAEPIPGYRLIDRLGGGGFGEVWRAEAPGGLHKAIKFVYGDLGSAGDSDQRAKQEMKALERVKAVRHPYILSLERYEVIDGQLVIVMELADRNLWDRFKEARSQGLPGIPRDELLRYMDESAEALDLMNSEYQLQHLDIKPQNLFLVYNHIKVADFGLVKDMEGSNATVTGGITPVYAAPETFDGKVSRFSDQYSLAIVYQELLTGQRPFIGNNVRQLIMQHISAEPNLSALPPADQPILRKALSKKPADRYPNCRELVQMLRAASPGAATAAAPPTAAPVSPSAITGVASVPVSWQGVVTPPPSSGVPTANMRSAMAETPSAQGLTHCIRAPDQSILSAPGNRFRPSPEQSGSGCLFPSLVIGLGQVGLTLIQKVRELVHRHVAPLSQLGHLRFLLIDTDPDIMRLASRGAGSVSLTTAEVMLTQLNRPSHYLKPRDGRPSIDSWLNPRMLYRIPRSQVTTGVRSLGRLAFLDNYRMVARRLQMELETILDPEAIQASAALTGLGLRSTRPRVYVLTGLGGGTGSGMFIDLAYTLRALIRQLGFENPDVVALLLLPPVDSSRTRAMTLGNTYAALSELNYFGMPGTVFQARYHDREPPLQDAGPPFSRIAVLPFPDEGDEVATQELVDLAGQTLYRELATPLGKAADLARAGLPSPPWDARGQFFHTFNMFQISWPRQALVQALGRQLCQKLVQRWASKDARPVRDLAQQWVQEQWVSRELGADCFIRRIQTNLTQSLGKPAESAFHAIIEPLNRASAQGDATRRGRAESRGLDPEQLAQALEQLEKLVGRPQEDHSQEDPPLVIRMLRDAAKELSAEWSQQLAEITVRLIEEPEYRLAGAEEAIRQLIVTIEQVLQHHEPLGRELAEKAAEAHENLRVLSGGQPKDGKGRPRLTAGETLELLKAFPKWRYQSVVLQHLAASFVGLRGHLSDELREVNFCRVRLAELLRLFEEPPPSELSLTRLSGKPRRSEASIGRTLFLSGCKDLHEAVDLYMSGITPEHLLELDGRMEAMLRESFTALVHVCVTHANILKDVYSAMLNVASEYAAGHLPPTSVAELFFEQFNDPQEAEGEVGHCYDEAAPEISVGRSARLTVSPAELTLIATPDDQASEQFKQLVQSSMPQAEIHYAVSTEDIIVYRERVNLAFTDLDHMGPTGHNAYLQMTAAENFTPHSRSDLNFRVL
jgi:serine/threonine protein kinase